MKLLLSLSSLNNKYGENQLKFFSKKAVCTWQTASNEITIFYFKKAKAALDLGSSTILFVQ